mgnify:CR=1 FL=1
MRELENYSLHPRGRLPCRKRGCGLGRLALCLALLLGVVLRLLGISLITSEARRREPHLALLGKWHANRGERLREGRGYERVRKKGLHARMAVDT